MEGFISSSFLSCNSKPSSIDIADQNMELLINPFTTQYDNIFLNTQSFMGFTNDNFFSQPILPSAVLDHQFFQPVFQHEKNNIMVTFAGEVMI